MKFAQFSDLNCQFKMSACGASSVIHGVEPALVESFHAPFNSCKVGSVMQC